MNCPLCNSPLKRNKVACSMKCYGLLKSNIKQCVICDKPFFEPPSSSTITCGEDCSAENRRRLFKKGVNDEALKAAHEKLLTNPLTGRFSTHMHAKEWVIQSPTGEVYKCRNLKNWLRENEQLLDGTYKQAWDGISKIKYSAQGKRKNNVYQWKGWRLLAWSDN
ncbi:hypothetical protein EBB07_29410 [Paenibacillaceae bacterium]|nr:hypothetical protein EBB07_29410 [Paenibacillaceae bacterium]